MASKRNNGDARAADLAGATLTPAEEAHIAARGEAPLGEPPAEDAPPLAEPAAPAPPAETEIATPPVSEPTAAESPETKTKTVPHAALHEERALRKAAEKRAQLLEERTNLMLQHLQQGRAPEGAPGLPVPPSYEQDREGHLRRTLDIQNAALHKLLSEQAERHATGTAQVEVNQLYNRAAAGELEFARANPDYGDAMAFLAGTNDRFLTAQGYAPPHRAILLQQQKLAVARKALAEDRNPAEVLYEMAQAIGWRKPSAAPPAASAERLSAVERGQRQGATLSQVRGAGPQPLTAQRLLEMSDSEFARVIATPEGRALLGA
jgi:hypothetical protein